MEVRKRLESNEGLQSKEHNIFSYRKVLIVQEMVLREQKIPPEPRPA